MRKFFVLLAVTFLMLPFGFAQNRVTFTESFNGANNSFTRNPSSGWTMDTLLSVSGKAAWGYVPNAEGDSIELISPVYDLSNYAYAYLRFSHICKVSDADLVTVEYRENFVGSKWTPIPYTDYKGSSSVFRRQRCFHHGCYLEWLKNDLTAQPDNTWWKVESFDVSQDVAYAEVQFKFKLKKGSTVGTNFAWGWFIDNFELMASTSQINPPVVQFVSPFTSGLVYGPGPYTIYAKVAKRTVMPLSTPVMRIAYTSMGGKVTRDSILMTPYEGDSMWKATIPQQLVGTQVTYTIFATDTVGNNASATSGYTIGREWGLDSNCVALLSIDTPMVGALAGQPNKVYAKIQNRGLSNLKSAMIRWSVNGIWQTPVKWTGDLPEGFTTSAYLGTYLPAAGGVDTLAASVSQPNQSVYNNIADTFAVKGVYSCASYLSGTYKVSPTGKDTSVNAILDLIRICGVSGDVTIALDKGTYAEDLDFTNLWPALGNNKLTVTSATGKAEDVVIVGTAPTSLKGRIANSRNLVLTYLTFEGMGGGIYIEDTNDNIEISHCRFLLDTTTTTTYACLAIQKGRPNKIKITDNYLRGTYFGFYSSGVSATQKITNVTITNNVIHGPYYYGTYIYYTDLDFVKNNTIVSRLTDASATFYGMYLYYSTAEEVSGNRIRTASPINSGRGLYPYYFNQDSSRSGLFANNEVIFNSTGTSYGIYTGYSEAEFYHNTVIMYGNGASYGVYCVNSQTGMDMHFYNNNFVCYNGGYPMYFSTQNLFGNEILLDYNNCYGEKYLGYIGSAITDLKTWSTKSQDQNALNVTPNFYDYTLSGKCVHYTGLSCPVNRVTRDILDSVRNGSTAVGCYTSLPAAFDAVLLRFEDWRSSVVIGQATPVKVRLMNNSSKTNLTSVQVNWMANDKLLTPYKWTGNLAPYQDTVFLLGTYIPKAENNRVVAWISQPNAQQNDDNGENDTIRATAYGCVGPMNGKYTIGENKDFTTLADAFEILSICGVGGPVTFMLDKGEYSPLSLGPVAGTNGTNTVTITSATGKAEDVVFTGGSPVVNFNTTAHIRLTNVTVNAVGYNYGIYLTGSNRDIQVKHCIINLNPNTTSGQYGFYCYNAICDSIYLIGNHFDGGYYGIYFSGGTANTAANHGRYNRIDSNTFTNVYYYSVYTYYSDFESFSHNYMKDRAENGNGYFYGLYSYYCNHRYVVGNKVRSTGSYHTNSYGLYIYYSNYNTYAQSTTDTTYLLNNDCYIVGSNYTYGLYCYYGNMQVMHNTVYAICTGTYGYGIYTYDASPYYCQMRNNTAYVKGGTYYPIYCNGTISFYQLSDNNYYHEGHTNLAYMGGQRNTLTAVRNYDKTATNLLPDFIDPVVDGKVSGNAGLTASPVTNVYYQQYGYRDLLNTLRPAKDVTRGAYEVTPLINNAQLTSFNEPSSPVLPKGTVTDVKVVLRNRGDSTLTSCEIGWDINGVSQPATKWTGNLSKGMTIVVKIGTLSVLDSAYQITAYVTSANGKKDDLASDDTVRVELQGCSFQLSGTYRIGNSKSADMPFERAMQVLEKCGVAGPVVLKIESGTYVANLNLSEIIGITDTTPITITSFSGNAGDVVISAAQDAPTITLSNIMNFTLSNVTVKGYVGAAHSTAIQLTGGNKNVTIRGCHLSTAKLNSQTAQDVAIYSYQPAVPDTVLVIVGNTFTGNGGIYLYGNSSTRSHDVRIDSNRILSPYYHAIYTYYYDIRSINSNLIWKAKTESSCYNGIYPVGSYGVANHATTISNNRVHGAYNNMLYLTNSYSMGYTSQNIKYPLIVTNNEFICSGSSTGYNFTLWNSGGYLLISHNTLIVPKGSSRTYLVSMYTYNPGHFKFLNNNLVNYGSCTNIYYTNMANQPTYMDVWDYNNYWIGNGQFNLNGATTKTVSGFSALLQNGRDAHSTTMDPRIVYDDSIAKPSSWGGLLCQIADSVYSDITGMSRSSITYKGCYMETYNVDAAMLEFVEPSDKALIAGNSAPVKVKLMNMGGDTIQSLTIRWTVDGVAQPPVNVTKLNLATQESAEVSLGNFFPGANQTSTTIVAWSENPNGRQDNNPATDTITSTWIVCGKALAGKYVVGSSPKADFNSLEELVSLLNYCGVSAPVVIELETGNYPNIELSKIPGTSSTNTVTFTSAIHNREAVVIGENSSPAVRMDGTCNVIFKDVTIGSASSGINLVAVLMSGFLEDVLFHHCNLYVSAATTSNGSSVVNYANTATSSVNYLSGVRFIGNNVRGGYYGFNLNYAGGNAANCMSSAKKRASVRMDSNYIYDQYYYPVYSNYYSHVESFSHNRVVSRSGANYSYGVYFNYYNLIDSVVGNSIHVNVSSYAYGGLRLNGYINYTSTFGSNTMPAVVANNEVISIGGTYAYGIYATSYVHANIVNNSVYCKSPTNYALYLGSQSTYTKLDIMNNIFMTENGSTNNYMVYVSTATTMSSYAPTFDYNDYFTTSTRAASFYSSSSHNFASWQSAFNTDGHSVQVRPDFQNLPDDLSIGKFDDQLKCSRHLDVLRDINNDARTSLTIMGAYSTPLFEGFDLKLEAFVEPEVGGIRCFPNSTPVKLGLYNMGTYNADFSVTPVTFYVKCESDSVNFLKSLTLNKGGVNIMKRDTFEVLSNMDITYPGMYKLTAWIEWTKDQNRSDDTIRLDYYVDKTVLPYDNDFTGQFAGVATNQACGDISWEVVGTNPVLNPVFGTGSLLFRSSEARGSICHALFTSVSLQGTYNPHLYFWYAHDNANPYLRDQMEVRISQDGGATFKTLQTLYRYDAKCTTPTWREYKIDLSKYSTGSCIIIAFTAYSYGGGDQTVDRVKIIAQQDMRVLVEAPSETDFEACNMTGRSLKVYLENLTSQEVPFKAGDSITVEMSGASNFVYRQALSGRLENREIDSMMLGPIDYVGGGQFDVKVYVNAIDSNAVNDTAKFSLNLNPDLAVTRYDAIGFKEPGDTVYVGFTVKNTGNLDVVSPFDVIVVVNGEDTVKELVTSTMKVGDTLYYRFKQGVIVPKTTSDQPYYLLDVYALLSCDANGNNDSVRIEGRVNIIDNGILSIITPASTPCALGGDLAKVEVRLYNNGTVDNTDSVVVTAVIDSAGVVYATLTEKIAPMYSGENRNYTFRQTYRVPRLSVNGAQAQYKVRAFLGALEGDIDLSNDTASVEACVQGGVGVNESEANRWTVGQNVPNPASELTRIPYVIPEAGVLTLRIMGMNGQVLYREDVNAEAGSGNLRVNLSDLAAGVYYYSVEYRGERIVKKMNVTR